MSRRKTFITTSITALLIATLACSGPGAATPDVTATFAVALTEAFATAQAGNLPDPGVATQVAQSSDTPAASSTPLTLPQATVIKPSDTPAPTNTPGAQGCSDGSEYVADVTIPDNTLLNPGQSFTKTWRIKNSGTCTWVSSYQFAFVADNQMGGPASVAISGNVAPGSLYDVSVNLVAPATPGTYKGSWRMKNAEGQFFGSTPFVQIVVPAPTNTSTPVTPTATLTATATSTLPPAVVLGMNANDYNGNWYNNDVTTGGVTQIQVSASKATVQAWGRCHPSDCNWGLGSGTIVGTTLVVTNFGNAPGNSLVLSFTGTNALHAIVTSSGTFNYDFHPGPVASDFVGIWTNANASTNNITKFTITASGSQITIHPYGKCSPTDCDWGEKTFAFSNPINTGSAWSHNLLITFMQANEIRVQDTTVSITDTFYR
jgi:hypothetical protein